MNTPQNPPADSNRPRTDSLDAENVIVEGSEDTTVRPLTAGLHRCAEKAR
jgi:hypothetical protein